eukprot:CAMPEP_0170510836 /NCGR_PEP_ID=MMETSP0208-20121228/65979_1 /TAXON_ID=197538 /ORGANISM="Strombidium inclinatum, Strain S3" /LENGTH=119 /DNA_ID=CAMNT_0010794325 /DNA_START=199 /DNA_END=558 /DNA_ORIENTATION=+
MLARLSNLERFQVRCEGELTKLYFSLDDHTARMDGSVKVLQEQQLRTTRQVQDVSDQLQDELEHLRQTQKKDLQRVVEQARHDSLAFSQSLEATRSDLQQQISRMQKLTSTNSRKLTEV